MGYLVIKFRRGNAESGGVYEMNEQRTTPTILITLHPAAHTLNKKIRQNPVFIADTHRSQRCQQNPVEPSRIADKLAIEDVAPSSR